MFPNGSSIIRNRRDGCAGNAAGALDRFGGGTPKGPKSLVMLRLSRPAPRWILLGLTLFLSGCVVVPVLAVEATVEVISIAARSTDPNNGAPIEQPSTPELAKTQCAENGAGPDTQCVDYMTHLTGSNY
jgi:hypothetical protein